MADLRLEPMHMSGPTLEPEGDRATVGRLLPADLVVSEASVSRIHAVLQHQGAHWRVIDQGSVNGTFLDGKRITSAELRAGQELRFGSRSFRVRLEAPAQPVPAGPPRPRRVASVPAAGLGSRAAPPGRRSSWWGWAWSWWR